MSIIKMSWNIISPYNILAIRARYKPISAWRSITNRYYLPQPFLNMTENEYKKKSFARFWHWAICWRIKIFSKNTSADLSLKHTLHFLGWVFNLFGFIWQAIWCSFILCSSNVNSLQIVQNLEFSFLSFNYLFVND